MPDATPTDSVPHRPTPARPAVGATSRPLTPGEQLDAIRKVQAQAEQRVKLGMQLFKAAEAHVSTHREAIDQVRREQAQLQQRVQEDVAKSLQQYDQWLGRIDEGFTRSLQKLEQRLDEMQQQWQASQGQLEAMVRRSEALLDQARQLMTARRSERQAESKPPADRAADEAPSVSHAKTPQAPPTSPACAAEPVTPAPADVPTRAAPTDDLPTDATPDDEPIYTQILHELREQTGPATTDPDTAPHEDRADDDDDVEPRGLAA